MPHTASQTFLRELDKKIGFADEELDYILNYDIKYCLGRGAGEEEDEA